MATRPISEGAPAPSNVVRLPTAAPRKVDNFRYAEQRQAVVEARSLHARRFQRKLPAWERLEVHEQQRYAFMATVQREPALLLAMVLLKCADFRTRVKIADMTGEAVRRDPECLPAWQAHQIAMALAGYRKEEL